MKIAMFASSLVSAYWNGAATYYRGILRALAQRGHSIDFFEPDAFDRQAHRDIADPPWANVHVFPATLEGIERAMIQARRADLVIKASGVGVFDSWLERRVLDLQSPRTMVAFWDVDAPATLDRVANDERDPFIQLIPRYDVILTYGGGPPVVEAYTRLGARDCVPIYNALDPDTHHPAPPQPRFRSHLSFLGNRLPDREARVRHFFFGAATRLPEQHFVLGGSGWGDAELPANVDWVGHVYTHDHNSFNCSARAVLNINRESMARYGFSPPTRVFEAAGAGACLITDAWAGIEQFLEPDREVLVVESADQLVAVLERLDDDDARRIGKRGRERVLSEHTYRQRARVFERALDIGPQTGVFVRGHESEAQRTDHPLDIVVLGLSITSSWGNGHATTFRGLLGALRQRGHRIRFLERDVPWYAANRDAEQLECCEVSLYRDLDQLRSEHARAIADADLVILGSFVPEGADLADWLLDHASGLVAFYDIDTPVTLNKLAAGERDYISAEALSRFDLVLSFTGGPVLDTLEQRYGVIRARPLYCAVDPAHYGHTKGASQARWQLGYMGTYCDDRQASLEELLLVPARALPDERFVVAGAQYPADLVWPGNVERIEHLPPSEHRGFYGDMRFTLNLTRRAMIETGHAPSVRLFEAALCGTPIMSDEWPGLDRLFEYGSEILIVRSHEDVLRILRDTSESERRAIAKRARARVLAEHTPRHRALALEAYVLEALAEPNPRRGTAAAAE